MAEPSIALSKDGKTLVFGESEATVNSVSDTGFVSIAHYDAKRKTLKETQRLTGAAPGGGFFGAHTALDPTGKVLAITEHKAAVNGVARAGAVHLYTKGMNKQWVLSGTVSAGAFAQTGLEFGASVALSKGGWVSG